MNFVEFNEYVRKLEGGCWMPTMFEDLQVQYCEERLYALRCKHGTPNEHICLIREASEDAAIARAVFDLHKADKNTSVTVHSDNIKRNCDVFSNCDEALLNYIALSDSGMIKREEKNDLANFAKWLLAPWGKNGGRDDK